MTSQTGLVCLIASSLNVHHGYLIMEIIAARYLIKRLLDECSAQTGSDLSRICKLSGESFDLLARARGVSPAQMKSAQAAFDELAHGNHRA